MKNICLLVFFICNFSFASKAIITKSQWGFKTSMFNNGVFTSSTCSSKNSRTNGFMTITVMVVTTEKCNGDSTGSISAMPANGTSPYVFSWSPSGQTNQIATGLSAGTYTVLVTDATGQTATASISITQPPPIIVSFNADSLRNCGNLCTDFVDLSTDYTTIINKWAWSFGDGDSSFIQNPGHCYIVPGSYNITLSVTDKSGCKATLTIPNMINVYSLPKASFTMSSQQTTLSNSFIQFSSTSTDNYGLASWLWNFDDSDGASFSKIPDPGHQYNDTGVFCVTLLVTNIHGCTDSAKECLTIYPPFELWIPNSFSPNDDGLNDTFKPKGVNIDKFEMYIFDRWGTLLFHSDNINQGWTGVIKKADMEDTYIYVINVIDHLGKTHNYLGRLTQIQ